MVALSHTHFENLRFTANATLEAHLVIIDLESGNCRHPNHHQQSWNPTYARMERTHVSGTGTGPSS